MTQVWMQYKRQTHIGYPCLRHIKFRLPAYSIDYVNSPLFFISMQFKSGWFRLYHASIQHRTSFEAIVWLSESRKPTLKNEKNVINCILQKQQWITEATTWQTCETIKYRKSYTIFIMGNTTLRILQTHVNWTLRGIQINARGVL